MCGRQFRILAMLLGIFAMRSTSQNLDMRPLPGMEDGNCPQGQKCVSAAICRNGSIIKDGSYIINIRSRDPCPLLETCCSTGPKIETPLIDHTYTPPGCGFRNPDGVGFKISRMSHFESQMGEFPWMVAILSEERSIRKIAANYTCCGSLITPQMVLTAAHCVHTKTPGEIKVRAGEWETNVETEMYPHQDRQVSEIILHEHFDKYAGYYDIALLFVEKPFDLAPNVNTICLPPASANFDFIRCYASGWGEDQFQNGKYQNILKKLEVPVVPKPKCEEYLRATRLGGEFGLHENFLCAGGELGIDTCTGDGGSPLMCPMPNAPDRYFQVGIVSWGIGCGGQNIPGVYANIMTLRAWIDGHLQRKRVQNSFYTP